MNATKVSQPSESSESVLITFNKNDTKRDVGNGGNSVKLSPPAMRYLETQEDFSSVNAAARSEDSYAKPRLLSVVNKESGQDVLENMETIVAKNVEQGKCAAFKRIENSNEKRSVNEPKLIQVNITLSSYLTT